MAPKNFLQGIVKLNDFSLVINSSFMSCELKMLVDIAIFESKLVFQHFLFEVKYLENAHN